MSGHKTVSGLRCSKLMSLGLSVFFSAWCSIWRVVRVVGHVKHCISAWPLSTRHMGVNEIGPKPGKSPPR